MPGLRFGLGFKVGYVSTLLLKLGRVVNSPPHLAHVIFAHLVRLVRSGMNKLVVNHLDKTIVTSDGATIVKELEVMHPAAKMVVMASQMQEQEAGDGTSLVVTLTGERSENRCCSQ